MSGTASENVSVLDDNFYFPSLQRNRRIWVYKPKDYETSGEAYPVIYMHDGQNLFDETTAFGAEWGVDETLDVEKGKVLIIGIENGAEHRMSEYMLHDHPDHGEAEGAKYLQDITGILKPFVDSVLRTKADPQFTCICGSSMGGLISLYAGLYFPHIFGSVGVLSPALWLDAPGVYNEAQEIANKHRDQLEGSPRQRWYFYAGALESETMVAEVASMVMIMRQDPALEVTYQLDAAGIHDEAVWKDYFPNLYQWFIGKKAADALESESHIRI